MMYRRPLALIAPLFALVIASSCSDSSQDPEITAPNDQQETQNPPLVVEPQSADITFRDYLKNDDQRRFYDELRARGTLTVALREGDESYKVQPDGTIQGFDYYYAEAFANALGIPLKTTIVQEIADFYAQETGFDPAVMSDENLSYQPALFNQVDVLAAPFAINAWRERLSAMVPFFPVGLGIIGRNVGNVERYTDLDGLSAAIAPGDYLGPFLSDIEQQHDIDIEFREYTESNVYDLLIEGFADFSVDGSLFLARRLNQLNELEVAPLKLSLVSVGWAVDLNDTAMQAILPLFVAYTYESGIMHQLWIEQMGVDFDFYLSITSN